jgi:hypothetical protein
VQIRGANGAGKSSVLDSIAAAIGGERLCPEVPIRRGETTAHVTVELDDMVVTRRWTGKGSYLEVTNKEGAVYKSPQKILDALVGALSFDPAGFLRLEPAKQLRLASTLVGLDTADLDAERSRTFSDRTVTNREAERLAAQIPEAPVGEVESEEESIAERLEEIGWAEETKRTNDRKRAGLVILREKHKETAGAIVKLKSALAERIAELKAEIVTLEGKIATLAESSKAEVSGLEARLADLTEAEKVAASEVAALIDPDVAALRASAKGIEDRNARVRQAKTRASKLAALAAKRLESDEMTARLAAIEAERVDRIAAARFPVDGLGFGIGCLTLNGLPFEQASSAEQLRVSLAMGLALNPKLRVILIRDGSLLDEKSLALVAEIAGKADAQVWLEVVASDGATGVLIEDGVVAERDG